MRKSRNDKFRESAIAFADHLSSAAGDMVSGRSFAATQMRRAAKLIVCCHTETLVATAVAAPTAAMTSSTSLRCKDGRLAMGGVVDEEKAKRIPDNFK